MPNDTGHKEDARLAELLRLRVKLGKKMDTHIVELVKAFEEVEAVHTLIRQGIHNHNERHGLPVACLSGSTTAERVKDRLTKAFSGRTSGPGGGSLFGLADEFERDNDYIMELTNTPISGPVESHKEYCARVGIRTVPERS